MESTVKQEENIKLTDKPVHKKRTWGNIIYDFGSYGSTAWLGVAAISAITAHQSVKGTNKYFDWLRSLNNTVERGFEKLFTPIMKESTPEVIQQTAKSSSLFFSLGLGGTILMAPLKWMEDNRQKNAAKIDAVLGTAPHDPNLAKTEPKQTWGSVLSGRFFSWSMSFVSFFAIGIERSVKMSKYFGEKATNAWMKLRPNANQAKVSEWMDIIAFDTLFTIITATLTYCFSRFVARKKTATNDWVIPEHADQSTSAEQETVEQMQTRHVDSVREKPRPIITQTGSYTDTILAQQPTMAAGLGA